MSRELDEACMRAMGWGYRPRFPDDVDGYWLSPDGEMVISEERLRFSEDLDAAQILENEIERHDRRVAYVTILGNNVLSWRTAQDGTAMYPALSVWAMLRATPEQRARAFLEVINATNPT